MKGKVSKEVRTPLGGYIKPSQNPKNWPKEMGLLWDKRKIFILCYGVLTM